jgi:adenylate kinase
MFIAISGTPGTGKTEVARILSRKINARFIDTKFLIKKYKIKTKLDRKRNTKIVDARKLCRFAEREAAKHDVCVFESHMAHFARADLVVILRCEPAALKTRLEKRRWPKAKITENVEAEAIGAISLERKAVEIDTTKKRPEKTAELIKKLLNNYTLQRRYGRIDWTEKYAKYLER